MNGEPINPTEFKATSKKFLNPRMAGGKYYLAVVFGRGYAKGSRRVFKRASEARAYADRLLKVWQRVYPLFVAWNAQSEPTHEVQA